LVPPELRERLHRLPRRTTRASFPYAHEESGSRPGVVLVAPAPPAKRTGDGTTGDDDASAHANTAQTLRSHTALVEKSVARFAKGMGLGPALSHDLALAARLHDIGKADPRFQRLLTDAGPFAPATAEPLAKSAKRVSQPGAWSRARLPDRWRHEALSVRMAMVSPLIGQAHDRALVLYLIGTHHGFGRPFFPHVDDADGRTRTFPTLDGLVPAGLERGPGPQDLDFVLEGEGWDRTQHDPNDLRGLDWFTMIRELHGRFGAWGLALLEATLRLADHRASAEGDYAP
jgi:CRISPR-associated endonuclease/helicase Cas3